MDKNILAPVTQNLGQENPEFVPIYGLGTIALVLDVMQGGNLVQKQVPSATLEKAILEGKTPSIP
jgi:hypothetical protein